MTGVVVFGVLTFWSYYVGNLTAVLAVPKPKMPFRTVSELANKPDYDVFTVNSSAQMTFLKVATKKN